LLARVTDGATLAAGASPPDPGATVVAPGADSLGDAAGTLAPQRPAATAGVLTPPPAPTPRGSGSTPSAASISFTLEP